MRSCWLCSTPCLSSDDRVIGSERVGLGDVVPGVVVWPVHMYSWVGLGLAWGEIVNVLIAAAISATLIRISEAVITLPNRYSTETIRWVFVAHILKLAVLLINKAIGKIPGSLKIKL